MHSENLSIRINDFAIYLNQVHEGPLKDLFFSEAHIYKLVTAAWLHDIGKIVVPLEILDKPTRLDERITALMDRYKIIELKMERNYLKSIIEKGTSIEVEEAYAKDLIKLNELRAFVEKINSPATIVDDEQIVKLYDYANYHFSNISEPLLTNEELKNLSIRKGTLTADERLMIEEHISAGGRILSELKFPDYLEDIYEWIINHHEYLDGSGYVGSLKGDQISTESRIMTILDIFDSLVQSNRPYKKSFAPDKAISILKSMSHEGKLDADLVEAFVDSGLWKK
jgi:HD-GYP domain-containing protein (c-di-GMP phosphodiesterase class II)